VYPPDRNTWQFPPPPVPRRYRWVAVLASLTGFAAAIAMLTVSIVVGTRDYPGVIDDKKLTGTIASACELMTRTVESMPVNGSPERRGATIGDQNRAVEKMLDTIRSRRPAEIRDDRPAEQWLRDWESLVEARKRLARELLRDPNTSLEVPLDPDGNEITERMNDVWANNSACEVPAALIDPDLDHGDEI
jgi:hypothetical protein